MLPGCIGITGAFVNTLRPWWWLFSFRRFVGVPGKSSIHSVPGIYCACSRCSGLCVRYWDITVNAYCMQNTVQGSWGTWLFEEEFLPGEWPCSVTYIGLGQKLALNLCSGTYWLCDLIYATHLTSLISSVIQGCDLLSYPHIWYFARATLLEGHDENKRESGWLLSTGPGAKPRLTTVDAHKDS